MRFAADDVLLFALAWALFPADEAAEAAAAAILEEDNNLFESMFELPDDGNR